MSRIALLALAPLLIAAQAISPIKWDELPSLPFREPPVVIDAMTAWVAGEYRSGRCPAPPVVNGRRTVRADIAVLLSDEGTVRATVPRAIDCSTVEQYAAGIVLSATRNNLTARGQASPGWYRASLTFDWAE